MQSKQSVKFSQHGNDPNATNYTSFHVDGVIRRCISRGHRQTVYMYLVPKYPVCQCVPSPFLSLSLAYTISYSAERGSSSATGRDQVSIWRPVCLSISLSLSLLSPYPFSISLFIFPLFSIFSSSFHWLQNNHPTPISIRIKKKKKPKHKED